MEIRSGEELQCVHIFRFFLASLISTAPILLAHGQTYTDLHDFNPSAGDPSNFNSTGGAMGIFMKMRAAVAEPTAREL
jgi:hypothetical protein